MVRDSTLKYLVVFAVVSGSIDLALSIETLRQSQIPRILGPGRTDDTDFMFASVACSKLSPVAPAAFVTFDRCAPAKNPTSARW